MRNFAHVWLPRCKGLQDNAAELFNDSRNEIKKLTLKVEGEKKGGWALQHFYGPLTAKKSQ